MQETKRIPFAAPLIGEEEREAVLRVLEGPTLTHGPRVKEFEAAFAKFTGAPYAVATASCTASLHLAYMALGVGPGDEVIVPAQTHVATAHAVELCGAKPIFVDSEPRTGNMDLDQVESRITPRTRAISPVHYLGMPVDMDRLTAITRRHGLRVIEDCALAIGTYFNGTHAGLSGDAGCFSFYPAKHITTAEGGMFITNDARLAAAVATRRAFGIDKNVVSERHVPGVYDVTVLGLNYRLNEIGAAMGLAQMQRLPGILRKRRENYEALTRALRGVSEIELLESSHDGYQSSYYCLVALLRPTLGGRRLEIVEALKQRGVETSVYYPRPVPALSYYREKYGHREEEYPVAARLSAESIALPVGPHVEMEDVRRIAEALKSVIWEKTSHERKTTCAKEPATLVGG
jgi:dTDP-4-amino-4,6-dideoxygalactose transaminase